MFVSLARHGNNVKNTKILDQLPCLRTCVKATTLMDSNRSKACAVEGKRRKTEGCGSSCWEDFFNEGLCSLLLWSIAGVHCSSASAFSLYTNSKWPLIFGPDFLCLVYFRGFFASDAWCCCGSIEASPPLMAVKKRQTEEDRCTHNANRQDQRGETRVPLTLNVFNNCSDIQPSLNQSDGPTQTQPQSPELTLPTCSHCNGKVDHIQTALGILAKTRLSQ